MGIMSLKEYYSNMALYEQPISFEAIKPMVLRKWGVKEPPKPEDIMEPVEFLENGDIIVRIYAPGATDVKVRSFRMAPWKFEIEMTNRGNGIYEGTIPASVGMFGNSVIIFSVDGSDVINPYLPTQFSGGSINNYIEVYDKETPYTLLRDVPHGALIREVFWSKSVQSFVRCLVYTPPGYEKSTESYPVLYIQHGGGENETCWAFNGKLTYIMDNNIADGKSVPFIVVMNNGMLKAPHESAMNDFDGIEGIITEDCRKFIEDKYRVKTDKWSRAIAGLSLGSMQASYIGLRHPELFGSIGSFTYMRLRDRDNTFEGNPHLNALKDYDKFWSEHDLLFRSIGGEEAHLHEFQDDDAFIESYGIDKNEGYVRHIYPGQVHNWNCWRRALNDFTQVVFKKKHN
jgi:enterochelin esterase-like enzyme